MRRLLVFLCFACTLVLALITKVNIVKEFSANNSHVQSVATSTNPTSTLNISKNATSTTEPTSTALPTLFPTLQPNQTAVPTLTADQINCNVPVTLMLHWSDAGVLPGILDQIQNEGYTNVTYRKWYEYCQHSEDTSRMVILTFDDAGPYGIYYELRQMISYADQRGLVGVVGVTLGDLQQSDWDFLNGLKSRGWEIANHSKTHPTEGFPSLSSTQLKEDILYVQEKVFQNTGEYPQTLILPGGNYDNDTRIDRYAKKYGIRFLVGIATPLDPWITGSGPYYVGRTGTTGVDPWIYALQVFNPGG